MDAYDKGILGSFFKGVAKVAVGLMAAIFVGGIGHHAWNLSGTGSSEDVKATKAKDIAGSYVYPRGGKTYVLNKEKVDTFVLGGYPEGSRATYLWVKDLLKEKSSLYHEERISGVPVYEPVAELKKGQAGLSFDQAQEKRLAVIDSILQSKNVQDHFKTAAGRWSVWLTGPGIYKGYLDGQTRRMDNPVILNNRPQH